MYSKNGFSQTENNQIGLHITALNGWATGYDIDNEAILDISEGGLKANIRQSEPGRFENTETLDIQIMILSEDRLHILDTQAQIVWSKELLGKEDFTLTIGLKFTDYTEEFTEKLNGFLDKRQKDIIHTNKSNLFRRKKKRFQIY